MRKSTSFFASFFFSIVFLFASRLLAQVDWTHISDQPVLSYGESGSWDKFLVGFPAIIKDGDTLKMWYTGGTQGYKVSNLRIGYAWSTDGTNWHRYERNPIISASLNWEGSQLEPGIVIKDGNLYKMWYSAGTLTKTNIGYAYSENGINWTKHSEAVLTCGPAGDWDVGRVGAPTVIKKDGSYKMWYQGATDEFPAFATFRIGYATSSDGIQWEKYNDPATPAPFSASDPVLSVGNSGEWDSHRIGHPCVLPTEEGFEMWFNGTAPTIYLNDRIGYAISQNGITWEKWLDNPIIKNYPSWGDGYMFTTVLKFDNKYHSWFSSAKYIPSIDDFSLQIGYVTSPTNSVKYAEHKIDDSNGNNNGIADADESVSLIVTLTNKTHDAKNVSATLSTNDPDVQLIQTISNFGDVNGHQNKSNLDNPFTFSVSSNVVAHYSTFYLDIMANDTYALTDSFQVIVGTPIILLVDDDCGKSYEKHYLKHIIQELWDVSLKGCPTSEVLQQYDRVVWFTGDDRDSTLTSQEQSVIANYLDGGGNLLLSGQNIAYDLDGNGSASDSIFCANYLRANFVADNANTNYTLGVSGDPISNGIFVHFTGNYGGAGNQTSPDVIIPISPAETIIKYTAGMTCAALKYENKTTNSRLVYLAFGFEGIAGPNPTSAAQLIEKSMTWLMGETSVMDRDIPAQGLPNDFALDQNYPNPFNALTMIEYRLPLTGYIRLEIFNVLGQRISTLFNGIQQAGYFRVSWDGKDSSGRIVPSGVYFYRLETENFLEVKKMLLLQ